MTWLELPPGDKEIPRLSGDSILAASDNGQALD